MTVILMILAVLLVTAFCRRVLIFGGDLKLGSFLASMKTAERLAFNKVQFWLVHRSCFSTLLAPFLFLEEDSPLRWILLGGFRIRGFGVFPKTFSNFLVASSFRKYSSILLVNWRKVQVVDPWANSANKGSSAFISLIMAESMSSSLGFLTISSFQLNLLTKLVKDSACPCFRENKEVGCCLFFFKSDSGISTW